MNYIKKELTDFVKKAVDKIYEVNEITVIIYDSIQETHDNTDDIVDDIQDGNKSHLIHSIAQQIENAEAIKYCWNDEDNNNLYEILMKVYRDNVIDLNKYNKEIFDSNPFIERVVGIAKELNKRMRNKIEIEKIRRLLNDIDLKDVRFSNVTPTFLQQKAKKYNIKPHHATKIFNKLTEEYDDDKEVEQTDYDDIDSKERELTEKTEEMLPPTPFIMVRVEGYPINIINIFKQQKIIYSSQTQQVLQGLVIDVCVYITLQSVFVFNITTNSTIVVDSASRRTKTVGSRLKM